jgi:hypothetical protein
MNTELESDVRTDEALEALFAKAAARPRPRIDSEERIRNEVREHWQQAVRSRKRRRLSAFAMAASVVLVAIVGVTLYQPEAPVSGSPLATVAKRFGELHIVDAAGVPYHASGNGFSVSPGQSISTRGDAGLALNWENGGSLRIDEYTSVVLISANEIELQRGRLYFDSNRDASNANAGDTDTLVIRTPRGIVTPLGTQYVTQMANDKLMVMVRKGAVSVQGAGFDASASTGEQMLVTADEPPVVDPVASYGHEWGWIEKTTPIWSTDGRSIFDFLGWVSRESGLSVRFESARAEEIARSASLVGYGQVDLEPSVALRIVMQTTDLDWNVDGGVIVVMLRASNDGGN